MARISKDDEIILAREWVDINKDTNHINYLDENSFWNRITRQYNEKQVKGTNDIKIKSSSNGEQQAQ